MSLAVDECVCCRSSAAQRVVDLGCGDGKLLRELLKDKQFDEILGMDVSVRSLEIASKRLRIDDLPSFQAERIKLIHGSLMWETLPAGNFRHADHRFDWTRQEFQSWATGIGGRFGDSVRFVSVGPEDDQVGLPTQMATFHVTYLRLSGFARGVFGDSR